MSAMNSKYQRIFSVVSDSHGIDPLRDKLIPMISKIEGYTNHRIQQDERGAPDLISLREYNTDELWWVIMAFNGISSYRSLVEGTILRIPNLPEVVKMVSDNTIRPNSVKRTITI